MKQNAFVLITLWFDNSSMNEYINALPLMEKFNLKGAISIPVDKIGTVNYMTWEQLHVLQNKGWEITSLGLSGHCNLSYYTTATTRDDLYNSKKIIMAHVYVPINLSCPVVTVAIKSWIILWINILLS